MAYKTLIKDGRVGQEILDDTWLYPNEPHKVPQGYQATTTSGRTIHFNTGQYNPTSVNGARLIAHEFTHILQYHAIGSTWGFYLEYASQVNQYGYWDSPYEKEAYAYGDKLFPK